MHRKMAMETSDVIISKLNRPWKFLAACLETLKISMEIAEVVLEYVFLRTLRVFWLKNYHCSRYQIMSDETCFVPVNNQDKSYYNYLLEIICKELVLICRYESLLDASRRPL